VILGAGYDTRAARLAPASLFGRSSGDASREARRLASPGLRSTPPRQ
jgi:hypothetical protein